MVALKQEREFRDLVQSGRKQERRGGIETSEMGVPSARKRYEAGTPWWH